MVRGLAQLKVLSDEFDVDEAAAPVLHLPVRGIAVLGCDAMAHVGDIEDQSLGIAWTRENGMNLGHDAIGERRRARDHPGARQRHMLPSPGEVLMVALERLETGRD